MQRWEYFAAIGAMVVSGCVQSNASATQNSIQTLSPITIISSETPPSKEVPSPSSMPTIESTTLPPIPIERSLIFASINDSMDGQLNINQEEAQRFYRQYWLDFLTGSSQMRELLHVKNSSTSKSNLVPNPEFVSFIKNHFKDKDGNGIDPTRINEGNNIDVFLDAVENSISPNGDNYYVPEGMPMPYGIETGDDILYIMPAPAFNAQTILVQVWESDFYLKPENLEIQRKVAIGFGLERYRWGQRFTIGPDGNTYLTLLITDGDKDNTVFGNNPLTRQDVDVINNNMSLFLAINKNLGHALVSLPKIPYPRMFPDEFYSNDSYDNYVDVWDPGAPPKYNVFELSGK